MRFRICTLHYNYYWITEKNHDFFPLFRALALVQEEEDTIRKQFDELNSKVDKILERFEQEVKEINAVATIFACKLFQCIYSYAD